VDCLTQYEAVATCERISEALFIPVLGGLVHSLPSKILGLQTDNGAEYDTRHVAKLLNKLLAKKSEPDRARATAATGFGPNQGRVRPS
jgi:hypothetical protein